MIFYGGGRQIGVENKNFVKCISAGTYSIDDFNTKIKVAVLQERQDWKPPQIKDLELVIPGDNTHLWPPIFFLLRLVYFTNILKGL